MEIKLQGEKIEGAQYLVTSSQDIKGVREVKTATYGISHFSYACDATVMKV